MAINFPTSIDSLSNPNAGDALNSPSHAGQHADANDAVEALQAKVGADSSAVATSHDYKINALETNNTGTNTGDVTLSGTPNYLTLANQVITLNKLDISDDTNLVAGTGITLTTNTLDVDASQTQITAVGTIATGTWEATDVGVAHGGTGASDAAGAKTNLGFITDVVDDTTPTLGGNLDAADKYITGTGRVSFTQELDNGSQTGNFSVDFGTDQKQACTLTANTITLTLDTTFDAVGNYQLKITNGGLATLTWASESGSIYWAGGAEPTLTSSGIDIISFYYDGTNWYGVATTGFATV